MTETEKLLVEQVVKKIKGDLGAKLKAMKLTKKSFAYQRLKDYPNIPLPLDVTVSKLYESLHRILIELAVLLMREDKQTYLWAGVMYERILHFIVQIAGVVEKHEG